MGSQRLVALVPARAGSKGIPRKNIRTLCGRPLLYWVCKAAQDTEAIDAVYVATDSEAIADTVRNIGLSKVQPIGRAPEPATDTASTESVMLDFAQRVEFDYIALLQATSPLLAADDLRKGCDMVLGGRYDSVLSAVEQKRFRWAEQPDGAVLPENYDYNARPRRQQFHGYLVENGAFYIASRAHLLETNCRLAGRIGAVLMPEDSFYELDEATDWTIIEALLARRLAGESAPLRERLAKIRFIATDVDGCLTDAGMYYGESGEEMKRFNTRDGMAVLLLNQAGIECGFITAENTRIVERRAAKLHIAELHQGARDKAAVFDEILARRGFARDEVAFLGDDVNDLPVLRNAGLAACPADAVEAVRNVAHIVLRAKGGEGALRELTDILIEARQRGKE